MKRLWTSGRIIGVSTLVMFVLTAGNTASVRGQDKALEKKPAEASPTPSEEDSTQFFTQKVRPVLAQSCYKCHTTESAGGLRLDSHAAVLKGGEAGPAIVPGDPEKSLLIEPVPPTRHPQRPPQGRQ